MPPLLLHESIDTNQLEFDGTVDCGSSLAAREGALLGALARSDCM